MWLYHQDTGAISRDGLEIARGYSGYPPRVNDPTAEALPNVGPIPRGTWTIGDAYQHATLGPVTMNLEMIASDNPSAPFGRGAFRIHGDRVAAPGYASHGCVVLPRTARDLIAASPDKYLRVCLSTDAAADVA